MSNVCSKLLNYTLVHPLPRSHPVHEHDPAGARARGEEPFLRVQETHHMPRALVHAPLPALIQFPQSRIFPLSKGFHGNSHGCALEPACRVPTPKHSGWSFFFFFFQEATATPFGVTFAP